MSSENLILLVNLGTLLLILVKKSGKNMYFICSTPDLDSNHVLASINAELAIFSFQTSKGKSWIICLSNFNTALIRILDSELCHCASGQPSSKSTTIHPWGIFFCIL